MVGKYISQVNPVRYRSYFHSFTSEIPPQFFLQIFAWSAPLPPHVSSSKKYLVNNFHQAPHLLCLANLQNQFFHV